MRRAYDDDPLAFVDTLMKRFGEAEGAGPFFNGARQVLGE